MEGPRFFGAGAEHSSAMLELSIPKDPRASLCASQRTSPLMLCAAFFDTIALTMLTKEEILEEIQHNAPQERIKAALWVRPDLRKKRE